MIEPGRVLGMYLHLARASELRRRPMVRDKLLVLAGITAAEMGLTEVSALCRQKVLAHNARHLVRKWSTLARALEDDRFQAYVKQLRRRYAPEKAEYMLQSLGIELGRERESYFSDHEYAAALLGETLESLSAVLANPPATLPLGPIYTAQTPEADPKSCANAAASRSRGARATTFWSDWGPFLAGALALLGIILLEFLLTS